MLKIKNYVFATSLEEAYTLNQKRSSQIIAGNGWLKMQNRTIATAIDLSALELAYIREDEEWFEIGAMATLRDVELHEGLNAYCAGAVADAVRGIVGVQFRNSVTVGGSVYSRFGFSDVCTILLALNAKVKLYSAGEISLAAYMQQAYDRDVIVSVIIPKEKVRIKYESFRAQATDFPVLNVALSKIENGAYRLAVGARPQRARVFECASVAELENCEFTYGTNMRASAQYREILAKALIKKCVEGLDYAD